MTGAEHDIELLAIVRAQERLFALLRLLETATDMAQELAEDDTLGPEVHKLHLGLRATVEAAAAANKIITARADNLFDPE